MKILLPVILLVIIAILGCALRYEVVQKNYSKGWNNRIGAETAKNWQQYIITASVQNYKDLERGDVDTVKENLKVAAIVYAKYYVEKNGKETGTKFAPSLSEALDLYHVNQADNWANLTNSIK